MHNIQKKCFLFYQIHFFFLQFNFPKCSQLWHKHRLWIYYFLFQLELIKHVILPLKYTEDIHKTKKKKKTVFPKCHIYTFYILYLPFLQLLVGNRTLSPDLFILGKDSFLCCVFFVPATPSEFGKVCDAYTFQCANGVCVSLEWKCDGMDDCGDYSDEANCGKEPAHRSRQHLFISTRCRHVNECVCVCGKSTPLLTGGFSRSRLIEPRRAVSPVFFMHSHQRCQT